MRPLVSSMGVSLWALAPFGLTGKPPGNHQSQGGPNFDTSGESDLGVAQN